MFCSVNTSVRSSIILPIRWNESAGITRFIGTVLDNNPANESSFPVALSIPNEVLITPPQRSLSNISFPMIPEYLPSAVCLIVLSTSNLSASISIGSPFALPGLFKNLVTVAETFFGDPSINDASLSDFVPAFINKDCAKYSSLNVFTFGNNPILPSNIDSSVFLKAKLNRSACAVLSSKFSIVFIAFIASLPNCLSRAVDSSERLLIIPSLLSIYLSISIAWSLVNPFFVSFNTSICFSCDAILFAYPFINVSFAFIISFPPVTFPFVKLSLFPKFVTFCNFVATCSTAYAARTNFKPVVPETLPLITPAEVLAAIVATALTSPKPMRKYGISPTAVPT